MEDDSSPLILASNFWEITLQPFSIESLAYLAVILILLFCSAIVSGSEVAFFSLAPQQLNTLEENKSSKAKKTLQLLKNPDKILATVLIANNLINITIVILSTYLTSKLFIFPNPFSEFLVQVVVITFLIVLFGEIVPKIFASRHALQFALWMTYPVAFLDKIFTPISFTLIRSTAFINKRISTKKEEISMDEIAKALELTAKKDQHEEQKILMSIVEFGNIDVKEIMRPRLDVFALEEQLSFEKVLELIVEFGYSRVPIYKEHLDRVVGILYIKDLIPYINEQSNFAWQELIRPAYFVPENKMINNLLKEFREKKIHLAIVVDEYGGTSGIITLEDILEEIVGEIHDEFDDDGNVFSILDQTNYIFEGKISLHDFLKTVNGETDCFRAVKGDSDSLAGLILELNGNLPKKGDVISFPPYTFTIESADHKKIRRVKVHIE